MTSYDRNRPTAYLFSGQGSQYVGMGTPDSDIAADVRQALIEANDALGGQVDLLRLCSEGPSAELTLTANAQPAILAVGIGHYRWASRQGLEPLVLLGHSLGEYAAWVAADAIDYADAIRLVRVRGEAMQDAVPVGVGAMSAIISTPAEAVEELCESTSTNEAFVGVAVYNSPGNTVISGHEAAVAEIERQVTGERLGTVVRLDVSAPFHTPLLEAAAARLAEAIAGLELRDSRRPVASNVTGGILDVGTPPHAIADALTAQVVAPVRWVDNLRAALSVGAEQMLLLGPGTGLGGHVKRVKRRLPIRALDRTEDVAMIAQGGTS